MNYELDAFASPVLYPAPPLQQGDRPARGRIRRLVPHCAHKALAGAFVGEERLIALELG
jgi:hypothetical protein